MLKDNVCEYRQCVIVINILYSALLFQLFVPSVSLFEGRVFFLPGNQKRCLSISTGSTDFRASMFFVCLVCFRKC